MNDVIVEPIRRIREKLIERYGGIDGYFRHCQAQESAEAGRHRPRNHKRGTVTGKASNRR